MYSVLFKQACSLGTINPLFKRSFLFQLNFASIHTSRFLLVETKDPYQVLLIDKNADRKQIKTAYYRLSKQYHPDMNKDQEAGGKFKEIQDAYNVLGNEQNKKEYDRSRSQRPESNRPTGNPFQNGGMSRRTTPAAGGGFHHGKTSAYDFDEFNKRHYDRARASNFSGYSSSASSNSQEDLNSYWRTYQNERNEEMAERYQRKKLKFFGVLFLILMLYIFTHKSKQYETELSARKR